MTLRYRQVEWAAAKPRLRTLPNYWRPPGASIRSMSFTAMQPIERYAWSFFSFRSHGHLLLEVPDKFVTCS
jgi:hypothetical protein